MTTVGVLVFAPDGSLLICHPSGAAARWDIPKGLPEVGEPPLETACRELAEETGLRLHGDEVLEDLGTHPYRPGKNIHLYGLALARPVSLDTLTCCSTFGEAHIPEMDGYKLCPLEDIEKHLTRRMCASIRKALARK